MTETELQYTLKCAKDMQQQCWNACGDIDTEDWQAPCIKAEMDDSGSWASSCFSMMENLIVVVDQLLEERTTSYK
jgi:hypothetical protein